MLGVATSPTCARPPRRSPSRRRGLPRSSAPPAPPRRPRRPAPPPRCREVLFTPTIPTLFLRWTTYADSSTKPGATPEPSCYSGGSPNGSGRGRGAPDLIYSVRAHRIDISRMGSVGTQDAAPPRSRGQSERAFGGGSLTEKAFEGRSVGQFGCSRVCRRCSASRSGRRCHPASGKWNSSLIWRSKEPEEASFWLHPSRMPSRACSAASITLKYLPEFGIQGHRNACGIWEMGTHTMPTACCHCLMAWKG